MLWVAEFWLPGDRSCGARLWRRYGAVLSQAFEVLDSGDQQELVPRAREPAQSEPRPREEVFDLAEQRLDPLALLAGGLVGLGGHQGLGVVAGLLVDISLQPPCRAGGAVRFERAAGTVTLFGDVFERLAVVNGT